MTAVACCEEERVLVSRLSIGSAFDYLCLDVGVHVDRDLLSKQLLLASQLCFLVLHRVLCLVKRTALAAKSQIMLLTDVVQLKLSGDGLTDNVPKLANVVQTPDVAVVVVSTAMIASDNDRHDHGLGCLLLLWMEHRA